jgi:hypothetical protein
MLITRILMSTFGDFPKDAPKKPGMSIFEQSRGNADIFDPRDAKDAHQAWPEE